MSKPKSLLYNYIFNLIKTLCSILFPVITFAYSAHILGVSGVGQVNFARSFITYFTMVAMLGMNYYGTREVAKLRNDRHQLSSFTQEMLCINFCTTLLAYGLLFFSMFIIPKLQGYRELLLVSSLAILLRGMGLEWLYQGLEEYRYIALRSILFQLVGICALFLFVHDAGDTLPYTAVTVFATSGSYLLNFFHARRYIDFHPFRPNSIKKHLQPLFWLFAMSVSIELYTVLDSTMLGLLQGDWAVGNYTAAIKIARMVNTIIASIGVVLIPRLSYYIGNHQREKTYRLVKRAYNYTFLLSVPAAIGLFSLSDEIILLFSGSEFYTAAYTMRLLTPIVLVIPFSVATNQQIFIPMGQEKLILHSTLVGAAVNIVFNSLLIPRYAQNGAAVATVLAETAVAIVCIKNAGKFFPMKEILSQFHQYLVASLPIPVIVFVLKQLFLPLVVRTGFTVVLGAGLYFMILIFWHNPYETEIIKTVFEKIPGRRLKR